MTNNIIYLYFEEFKDVKLESVDFINKVYKKHTGIYKEDVIISKTINGKPYMLENPIFQFNVSHTKGAIICGVSNESIGVDIEVIKAYNKKLADRFFTKKEKDYLFIDPKLIDIRFAEIWTKKEAYVKFLGVGIDKEFESFDVLDQGNFYSINIENYFISICSNKLHDEQTFVKIEVLK